MGGMNKKSSRSTSGLLVGVLASAAISIGLPTAAVADLKSDLFTAIRKGRENKVLSLLQEGVDANATMPGSNDWHALSYAAFFDRTEIVNLLIAHGATINAIDGDGTTALSFAAGRGNLDVVKSLIEKGARRELITKALPSAFDRNEDEVYQALLEAGADESSLFLSTRWRRAEEKNDVGAYREFAQDYPDSVIAAEANLRISNPEVALFVAARIGTEDAAEGFLNAHGGSDLASIAAAYLEYLNRVNPNDVDSARKFIDRNPDSPFATIALAQFPLLYFHEHPASLYVNIEVLETRRGVSKDERRQEIWSEFADELDDAGLDSNQISLHTDQEGSATHIVDVVATGTVSSAEAFAAGMAAFQTSVNVGLATAPTFGNPTNLIVRNNALAALASQNSTPGVQRNNIESLDITISRASDGAPLYTGLKRLTGSTNRGLSELLIAATPSVKLASSMVALTGAQMGDELYILAENNDIEGVKALVRAGRDVNRIGSSGFAPLMAAAASGSQDLASLLIAEGADVNKRAVNGTTALLLAVAGGDMRTVNSLISAGSDVNLANDAGITPLMVSTHDSNLMSLLLEHGALVNDSDQNGMTALLVAAQDGNEDSVKVLLESGADINTRSNDGRSVIDLASSSGHEGVIRILMENGAETVNESEAF